MKYRNLSLEYFSTPTREFCKKYKIGKKTARRLYGSKYGLSSRDTALIVSIAIETKLLPSEIVTLLQEYTTTEIRGGQWRVKNGELIFEPMKMY